LKKKVERHEEIRDGGEREHHLDEGKERLEDEHDLAKERLSGGEEPAAVSKTIECRK
jgi:hypothetical protein